MTATRCGWSWGTGVLVAFGLFLAGILGMVVLSMSENVQLVTDRYYDNELRYQDRIQAMGRAKRMVTQVHMEPGPGCVLVRFPRLGSPDEVNGQVTTLTSGTYRLPVTFGGVQIDCPITKGYLEKAGGQNPWGLLRDARLRFRQRRGLSPPPETRC